MEALKQRLGRTESKPLLRVPTPTGNKKFAFSLPPPKALSTHTTPQKQSVETSPVPSMSALLLTDRSPIKIIEEEKKEEKIEPQIPARNPQAKIWLKTWLWTMVYASLLRSDIDQNAAEKRKKINLKAPETVKNNVNHAAKYIKDHSYKALEGLYQLTKSINILSNNKKSRFAKDSKSKKVDERNKQISVSSLCIFC